eukprot:TRINITY_DN24705_c0_g1_i1.p1 TRINITY_DN24705_c0_g1~~TRINITY_DN24705_c0_g1_i1.p1  ORF type:complete len:201 (+),score=22.01 TRINITY_DN24705_c0_g1_i1:72-674(+)
MSRKKEDGAQVFGDKHNPELFQTKNQLEYKNWRGAHAVRCMPEGGKTKSQVQLQCEVGQSYFAKKNIRNPDLAVEVRNTLLEYKRAVPKKSLNNPLSSVSSVDYRFQPVKKPTLPATDAVAAGKPVVKTIYNPISWKQQTLPPTSFESSSCRSFRSSGQLENCNMQRTGTIELQRKNILCGPKCPYSELRGLQRKPAAVA